MIRKIKYLLDHFDEIKALVEKNSKNRGGKRYSTLNVPRYQLDEIEKRKKGER